MLQEIDTQLISISPAAAQAVQDIINQHQLEGYALRVFVAGGGCCGVQFGMALDNVTRENDKLFESQGLRVVVDDQSIDYLRGATIEFVNDPMRGAGFVVNSPVASQGDSCACGSNSKEEGGCGCGGSCGCGGH